MDWFLYDNGLRHEKVKHNLNAFYQINIDQISVKSTFEYLKRKYLNYTRSVSFLSIEMKKQEIFNNKGAFGNLGLHKN